MGPVLKSQDLVLVRIAEKQSSGGPAAANLLIDGLLSIHAGVLAECHRGQAVRVAHGVHAGGLAVVLHPLHPRHLSGAGLQVRSMRTTGIRHLLPGIVYLLLSDVLACMARLTSKKANEDG
jgi:hypothetical protein